MDVFVICTWRVYFSSDFDGFFLLTEMGEQNLNFLIFHPILMQFFCVQNDHLYGLLMGRNKYFLLFYFEKGSKRDQNSYIYTCT